VIDSFSGTNQLTYPRPHRPVPVELDGGPISQPGHIVVIESMFRRRLKAEDQFCYMKTPDLFVEAWSNVWLFQSWFEGGVHLISPNSVKNTRFRISNFSLLVSIF